MMGIFFASGSLARTIGPIIISVMFEHFGPEATWSWQICMIILTFIMWCVCYKQIKPLDPNPKMKSGEYYRYDHGIKYRF